MAASTSRRRTSATSPARCCVTAWQQASAPKAMVSAPTTSSRNCSRSFANRRRGKRGATSPLAAEHVLPSLKRRQKPGRGVVMSQRYLDPEGLARVGNMELVARQVVEGFLTGRHRSPYHGFSVEYLDHRPYVPGDDLRSIDWKILARTDKYHVKLFEDETNLRAHILLDCSKSMAFRGSGLSKL